MTNWFKIFYRQLKIKPLYPLINMLGLVAGITCFLLAMIYVVHEYSYEKWNPRNKTIHRSMIVLKDGQVFKGTAGPLLAGAKDKFEAVIDHTEIKTLGDIMIANGEKKLIGKRIDASENFFEFFPFPTIAGNLATALEQKNAVILSSEMAENLFGDEDPMDQEIKLGANNEYIVKGIFNPSKSPSHLDDYNIITAHPIDITTDDWGNFNYIGYTLLREGTNLDLFNKDFKNYYLEMGSNAFNISLEEYAQQYSADLEMEPIADIHLFSKELKGGGANTIFILSLLSILILLISAINFINLSISSASQRAKEVAIRKTLGTTKSSLIKQFISEVLILCVAAVIISLALTELLLPQFGKLLNSDLNILNALENIPILFATIVILILAAGLFPAIYLSNFNPVMVLKGNFTRSAKGQLIKKTMLIIQIAISSVFLIAAYVIYKQIKFMNEKDLGLNKDNVVMISVQDRSTILSKGELYEQELLRLSNVISVTSTDKPPGTRHTEGSVSQVNYNGKIIGSDIHFVDKEFFPTLDVKIKQGRNFLITEGLDPDLNMVIINEKLRQDIGLDDPLGKHVTFWNTECEIVGVAENYITRGFDSEVPPAIYSLYQNYKKEVPIYSTPAVVMVKIKGESINNTISEIENTWSSKIEPGQIFTYVMLNEDYKKLNDKYRKLQSLVFALSTIMIIISLLGLFALASHSIRQRYKEIAIRKTLGVSDQGIIVHLMKEFVLVCFIALIISLPLAYYLSERWLQDFVYRIDIPYLEFLLLPSFILALTALIVFIQSKLALKVDLVKWLTYE